MRIGDHQLGGWAIAQPGPRYHGPILITLALGERSDTIMSLVVFKKYAVFNTVRLRILQDGKKH